MADNGVFPLPKNCLNCEVMFLLLHASGQKLSITGQYFTFFHVL